MAQIDEYVPAHCKASTANRRSVELFIAPRIGKRRVPDIQRSDIAALHHDMRETSYQANRTLGALSKMFNLAELWGLHPNGSNPCLHVRRFREDMRERFLSHADYQRLEACAEGDRAGRFGDLCGHRRHPPLTLAGHRLSESQKPRWEHADLDVGDLGFPTPRPASRQFISATPASRRCAASRSRRTTRGSSLGASPGDRPGTSVATHPDVGRA